MDEASWSLSSDGHVLHRVANSGTQLSFRRVDDGTDVEDTIEMLQMNRQMTDDPLPSGSGQTVPEASVQDDLLPGDQAVLQQRWDHHIANLYPPPLPASDTLEPAESRRSNFSSVPPGLLQRNAGPIHPI